MSGKILVMGFYGYGNTGDELILHGLLNSLRRADPDLEITVLSADPERTAREHQVKAQYAGRRFEGLPPLARAMRETDLFILGGGGLLQDRERRIIPYWLSRVVLAKLLGKKVMFYAQGVGPITTPFGLMESWADVSPPNRPPPSLYLKHFCNGASPPCNP